MSGRYRPEWPTAPADRAASPARPLAAQRGRGGQPAGPVPLPCAAEAAYAADLATVAHLFSGHEATDPVARALVDADEALRVCLDTP